MPNALIFRAIVFEKSGCQPMSRIYSPTGALTTQAGTTAITRTVTNLRTGVVISAATPLTIANVIFDALQTDARWTKDSTGYNFKDGISGTILTSPNVIHRVEYKVEPASGDTYWLAGEITTIPILAE